MLAERDYMKERSRDGKSTLPRIVVIRPRISKIWAIIILLAAAELAFILYKSL